MKISHLIEHFQKAYSKGFYRYDCDRNYKRSCDCNRNRSAAAAIAIAIAAQQLRLRS